jgi:PTS system galactitol-specific IIA component
MSCTPQEVIHPDLIITGMIADYRDQAIHQLASRLLKGGYVTEQYARAVLKSEYMHPTGLPTPDMAVAIPHTDVEHCRKSGIAVATLEQPVEFQQMTSPSNSLNVGVIFLLSFAEPNTQIDWHRRLATMFQRPGALKRLKAAPSAEACSAILRDELSD